MRKLLILGLAITAPCPANAQSADPAAISLNVHEELAESASTILVNGVRERADFTGEAVKVFDADDIRSVQGADLTRLVERSPGVSFNRNGGLGSFTSLHVRGAEGEQLLVLTDGVRVADPAAPSGGFDLGTLTMGNLAKVELQRNSNSTLWGSDAIGGVLAVTTGSGNHLSASVEYGAYDTFLAQGGTWWALGPAQVNFQATHLATRGFSAAANGSEDDGFRQDDIVGRVKLDLAAGLSAFANGRYAKARTEIDGFPAPAFTLADTAEYQETRQVSGVGGLQYKTDGLEVTADYSAAQTKRANFDPAFGSAPGFTAHGRSQRAELRGRWSLARNVALDFGGEREWTRFSTLFDPRHETAIIGGYAQFDYDSSPIHLAAGLRRDEHRDFGGHWSVGADGALDLSDRWRITASYGEGFKAPTLFQLHSDFGNIALRPETSRSYDAGIAYSANGVWAKITAFRRDTRGLIGFVSCFGMTTGICTGRPYGTYDNIGRARAQGVEIEGSVHPANHLGLTAAYTYLEAVDRTPGSFNLGRDLARRPRNMLTLSADWWRGPLRLGADIRLVSRSFDDVASAVPLEGYMLATLRGEWAFSDNVSLYGRVENLGDDHYQTAAGYGSAGRSAYVGARARF
jgi:vitamin B12 transporter